MIYIINPFENLWTNRAKRHFNLFSSVESRDAVYVTSDFDHASKSKINIPNAIEKVVVIPFLPYANNFGIKRFLGYTIFNLRLFLFLSFALRSGDIIVSTSISPITALSASLAGLLRNSRVYIDVRDLWPTGGPSRLMNLLLCHYHLAYLFVFWKAKKIAYTNKMFLEYNILSIFKSKCQFIPLGFNLVGRKKYAADKIYSLAYVGNFNSSFNLTVFGTNVRSKINQESTILIGDGPLLNLYKDVFPRAQFLGLVDQEKVDEVLSQCIVGLLPITGGASFPNKINDYVFHKLDVLTNNGKHLSNFVKNYDIPDYQNSESILIPSGHIEIELISYLEEVNKLKEWFEF